jgi:hypothetical protein
MPASTARDNTAARDDAAAAAPAASGLLPHPRNIPASPAQVTSINISHSSERPLPREQTIVASRKTTHTDTVSNGQRARIGRNDCEHVKFLDEMIINKAREINVHMRQDSGEKDILLRPIEEQKASIADSYQYREK